MVQYELNTLDEKHYEDELESQAEYIVEVSMELDPYIINKQSDISSKISANRFQYMSNRNEG